MIKTKLNITVEELAEWLERKDFIRRGNLGGNVASWIPTARRILQADALYEALRRVTDVLEYLDNPAMSVGRNALALADGGKDA